MDEKIWRMYRSERLLIITINLVWQITTDLPNVPAICLHWVTIVIVALAYDKRLAVMQSVFKIYAGLLAQLVIVTF